MIVTFKELGSIAPFFNGQTYAQASQEVINIACDYIMHNHFQGRIEEECIPDPNGAFVNFILQTVDIDTAIPTIN